MLLSDFALVVRWLLPLWVLGWSVFPFSRRLFAFLPDAGLAIGRVLAIALCGALGFWLAQMGLVPLTVSVWALPALMLAGVFAWRRDEADAFLRERKSALWWSDGVFLLSFAFFLWVRLRHPSLNDLEKPMDAMLLGASARTAYLPFEHPWFAGVTFTNYYFFGPFLGGMLTRLLVTPLPFAYNLVQPLFCALFLSVLWSLGALLTHSKRLGLGVMALVGLGGHLEPLRQLREGASLGTLDWWSTSRVIERVRNAKGDGWDTHTINEYPAFTMLIGDAHAHFYALALAATHFAVCAGIVCCSSPRQRAALIALGGLWLGLVALTNTWDVPLYSLLWALAVGWTAWREQRARSDEESPSSSPLASPLARRETVVLRSGVIVIVPALVGLLGAALVALPFFARFRSQVGGGGFAFWLPDPQGFALFWGAWIALGALGFGFGQLLASREGQFRRLLLVVGGLALLFPSIYFVGGVFAGNKDYQHQDTVFKFYLQAWLLGGTAIASEFFVQVRLWWNALRGAPRAVLGALGVGLALIVSLAPFAVWKTRTLGYGEDGLSLDGARWLPSSDRQAIDFLSSQNGVVAERLASDGGGDYDAGRGAVGTLSGSVQTLCWPNSHVRAWGFQTDATLAASNPGDAMNALVSARQSDVNAVFGNDPKARLEAARRLHLTFLVLRSGDPLLVSPLLSDTHFKAHTFAGPDGSQTVVLERQGF